MSSTLARKFRFVSPGIFLREVDNSELPRIPDAPAPTIIGRYRQGPAMRPFKVSSLAEFVEIFGNPIPGASSGDVWREGNKTGPTYAAYAAFAWLNAGQAPANIFRLLGDEHDQATTAGQAGWTTTTGGETSAGTAKNTAEALASNGGAYGLWIIPSGAISNISGVGGNIGTGSLAAIWYVRDGAIVLKGKQVSAQLQADLPETTGSAVLMNADDTSYTFEAQILDTSYNPLYTTTFNFDRTSENYIRKVFNTDPILTNTSVVDSTTVSEGKGNYFLGETFESNLFNVVGASGASYGMIVPIVSGNFADSSGSLVVGYEDHQEGFKNPETGWFFSQDLSTANADYAAERMTKLFKFHGLDGGEWLQNNIKISIADVKAPTSLSNPYGSFSIQIRRASDSDNVPVILEQFTNCNLNPASADYVAAKVGDMYMTFDYSTNRLREYGQYVNQSSYVRIEMNPSVEAGTGDPELLPFGVFGPVRPNNVQIIANEGNQAHATPGITSLYNLDSSTTLGPTHMLSGSSFFCFDSDFIASYGARSGVAAHLDGVCRDRHGPKSWISHETGSTTVPQFTASFVFPKTLFRISASDGGIGDAKEAYFGLQTGKSHTDITYDPGYPDYLRRLPTGYGQVDTISGPPADRAYSWVFSLDDVRTVIDGDIASSAFFQSGSRRDGDSLTAMSSSYKQILDEGYDRFTSPLYGGFDGLDIYEAEPFRNSRIASTDTQFNNYAYNTIKRAIDTCADPEFVETNLMTVPGVTAKNLTKHLIDTCESRADAMAVIDIEDVYTPFTENTNSFQSNVGTVDSAISSLRSRDLNSSYAATYYPWVQIRDPNTSKLVWVPPSVAALGTYASSEAKSELWFAPAGFTRGGLTEGAAGLPVVNTSERLVRTDRDKLYTANINPIANFPSEGIVIFGQKTLQVTPSALDRINVRRLMIFLKKEVSRIAAGILFDQNVKATWSRFLAKVNPFLGSVMSRLGITEFKVVLDETTTTADLIDRNILYAKIFLKPARSIEFIAIDFVISRTGASFED